MRRFVPAALLALVLGGAAWLAMRDRIGKPVAVRSAAASVATQAFPSVTGALDRRFSTSTSRAASIAPCTTG